MKYFLKLSNARKAETCNTLILETISDAVSCQHSPCMVSNSFTSSHTYIATSRQNNLISKIRKGCIRFRLGCSHWSGVTNTNNYSCNHLGVTGSICKFLSLFFIQQQNKAEYCKRRVNTCVRQNSYMGGPGSAT